MNSKQQIAKYIQTNHGAPAKNRTTLLVAPKTDFSHTKPFTAGRTEKKNWGFLFWRKLLLEPPHCTTHYRIVNEARQTLGTVWKCAFARDSRLGLSLVRGLELCVAALARSVLVPPCHYHSCCKKRSFAREPATRRRRRRGLRAKVSENTD